MALFPRTEPDIIQLAKDVYTGLERNPKMFLELPFPAAIMRAALEEYEQARRQIKKHQARVREALDVKNRVYQQLRRATKANLKAAEAYSRNDPAKLAALSWGVPRVRTRLRAAGQVMGLHVLGEGPAWIELGWKKPATGGRVGIYAVERRVRRGEGWEHAGSEVSPRIKLRNQPAGVALEFRVRAMNKTGEGMDSGVVKVVL